ncbi:conserved hypothetical protein [delta proteobacterium NaphS2]|nr:conserved hypothetical protein [delta proteobacterium NaphS2]
MCLLLLALDAHPCYKLMLAANRDEFYDRPTAAAAFWSDAPEILAGRDLRDGGTWLGITRKGRLAAITNYRDPSSVNEDAPSRGALVSDFLLSGEDPETYLARLSKKARYYNGFNLVLMAEGKYFWFSNRNGPPQQLRPGIYGVCNHLLNTPWPKVTEGKARLQEMLSESLNPESVFQMLSDRSIPPDVHLPDTGVGLEWERSLGAIFVARPGYGTRSSTLLTIDQNNHVTFVEKTHDTNQASEGNIKAYEFSILRK